MTGPAAPPIGWVDGHLAALGRSRTGAPHRAHSQPWSTVLLVPTSDGDVWVKAVSGDLRHEAAVHSFLAARAPERVPRCSPLTSTTAGC